MSDENRPLEDNPMAKYLKKPTNPAIAIIRGILGGIAGGTLGFFVHDWLSPFLGNLLLLPGAMLGLGFGLASRYRSYACGFLCGIAGFLLGCFVEWSHAPFAKDDSFLFFMTHLHHLNHPAAIYLLIGGGVFAFWFGRGR